MADNYSLDKKVRERYERLYTGVFYDRYIRGLWCMAEGHVYPNWSDQYVLRGDIRLSSDVKWYISIDYGTINPFSAGLWAVGYNNAIRVSEYYFNSRESGRMQTDEEYYEAVDRLAGDKPIEHIIVDPSAASFIECIRRHGKFFVRRASNEVLDGIRRTSTLIQNGRILIHEDCHGILREFALYRWNDKLGDTVIKENDHCMDELRYLVNTILRRTVLRSIGEEG
jgi:PBSX family phage terminase large subunit